MDVANETSGVTGNGAASGPAPQAKQFDELPYFNEYLQAILRPKIEKTLETMDRLLTEAAWRHIISTVATDQRLPPEIATTVIRPLLEQKLGLKMQVKLESQFATPPPVPAPAPGVDLGEGVTRTPGPDGVDVMTVRRRPITNPIANAVANSSRPMGR